MRIVTHDRRIPSAGDQLAAYLYRPAASALNAPCVVMAHGFSATRDDGPPACADAFSAAGYVVALFDYRGFGAPTGTPRQIIDIGKQHGDHRAVVAWVRTLDRVIAAVGEPGTLAAMTTLDAKPGFEAMVGQKSL